MTHLPEIGAENQYRFLTCLPCNSVPNFSGNEQDVLYFRTGLSYQFSGADLGTCVMGISQVSHLYENDLVLYSFINSALYT